MEFCSQVKNIKHFRNDYHDTFLAHTHTYYVKFYLKHLTWNDTRSNYKYNISTHSASEPGLTEYEKYWKSRP